MTGREFAQLRDDLPSSISKNNDVLGSVLGVSRDSVSNYMNAEGDVPQYIAHAMLMLHLICRENLHTLLLAKLTAKLTEK